MFNKKKSDKTEQKQDVKVDSLIIYHGRSEIEAAIRILNNAILSGQLPYGKSKEDKVYLVAYTFRKGLDQITEDGRKLFVRDMYGYLAQNQTSVIKPEDIKDMQIILEDQRKVKEEQLQKMIEKQSEAVREIERLSKELGDV